MNGMCNGTISLVPAPWGLGEGPKGQIPLNFNYKKSISKIFKPYFVYLLTNVRYQILDRIFIPSLGSYPRGGTLWCWWGGGGVKN